MTQRNLDFAIALAPGWQQIDLLAPEADQLIDSTLAAALARGARGGPHARLLMTRGLYAVTPTGEPLAAGLTVALADREAPVSSEPLEADDFGGAAVAAITLTVGIGLRVREIAPDTTLDAIEIPVLRVQYLIHTDLGLLTIVLTTFQAAHTEEWERFFDAVAQTAELG